MEGDVLSGLGESSSAPNMTAPTNNETVELFDIEDFITDLAQISEAKNRESKLMSNNVNSYDIAHNCIREVVFKLQNQPVESYQDVWLPILMRACLGNAVHDFIQTNSKRFTEVEVSTKVPSIRASVRSDALINNNVLVEIKSCTFSDYQKILKSRKPRDADFYQTVFNKYLIENHLAEAKLQKTRTSPPKLENYKFRYIQLIYVAHDIISADAKSISEALQIAKQVRQMLNSKYNKFHYITTITLDLSQIDMSIYENYVVGKLNAINYHVDNNLIPSMDNPYIQPSACYFCIYKKVCSRF